MYKQVIYQILALTPPEKSVEVTFPDGSVRQVRTCNISALHTLALNMILLLEGSRLAYRCDDFPSLVSDLQAIVGSELLSLPLVPEEPLLFLSKNTKPILSFFSDLERDVAWGAVLGYPYRGCVVVPGMFVSYWTRSIEEPEADYHLYTFRVPYQGYTELVRNRALEDMKKYDDTLKQYGFEVRIQVMLTESEELLDHLPSVTA